MRTLIALCLLCLSPLAHADYIAPHVPTMVRKATAVVDATLGTARPDGSVPLTVHATLAGQAPEAVTGTMLSCFGGTHALQARAGQRFVMLLQGDQLYEEQTFWPVRAGKAGLEVEAPDLTQARQGERRWQPLSALKATIATLRGAPR